MSTLRRNILSDLIHLILNGYDSNFEEGDTLPNLHGRSSYYMRINPDTCVMVFDNLLVHTCPDDNAAQIFYQMYARLAMDMKESRLAE